MREATRGGLRSAATRQPPAPAAGLGCNPLAAAAAAAAAYSSLTAAWPQLSAMQAVHAAALTAAALRMQPTAFLDLQYLAAVSALTVHTPGHSLLLSYCQVVGARCAAIPAFKSTTTAEQKAPQKPWFSGGSCISGRLFPSCNVCEWVVPGLRDGSAGGLQHPESDTCCCCCTLYDSRQGGRRAQQLLSRCLI